MMKKVEKKTLFAHNKPLEILVVEDDIQDFHLIQELLNNDKRRCYKIHHTTNIIDASEALEKYSIDVILLDLGLQDTRGIDTVKSLFQHITGLPVIVFTDLNDEELGEETIRLGAEDFIPKSEASTIILTRAINHAIERHGLLKKLQKQAFQDSLTGLANRSALMNKMETLVTTFKRSHSKLAAAMIDLDDFKHINDQYGHDAGDQLLITIAQRLNTKLRASDIVARLGGDEFIWILTNYTTQKDLKKVLTEKLAMLTKPVKLKTDDKEVELSIGVSIGVVEWHDELALKKLITYADKAMYKSKDNGKNQISFITPQT